MVRIETASAARGGLVMIGLFGLLFSVVFTFDQRIGWQIGFVLFLVSLATLYFAFTHPRFKHWIEFGEHLEHHDFSGIHGYEWDQVSEIRYVGTGESSKTDIILRNATTITTNEEPERFRGVATSLLPSLASGDSEARRRLVIALGVLAQINCYYSADIFGMTNAMQPDWAAEIISHLEKALEDSDESVRVAAANGLRRIRSTSVISNASPS